METLDGTNEGTATTRRGSALVASLIVVVLMAGLGAGLIQLQSAVSRRHAMSVDTKRALYVAEAGIAEAFSAIAVGKSGFVGTPEIPAAFGNGVYWVEAAEDAQGRIVLDSTGLCGSGRFSISAVVQRQVNPIGVNGVCGESSVEVGAGCIVDGYDSRLGTYESQTDGSIPGDTTGQGARIASNGDVAVHGDLLLTGDDTFVYGDVRPGVDGTLTADPDVVITGASHPLGRPVELPRIDVPDLGTDQGAGVATATAPLTLTGKKRYTSLTAQINGTVTLRGPLELHVDDLSVAARGHLVFDNSAGPIILYVSRSLLLPVGSDVSSVNPDPGRTAVYLGTLAGDTSTLDPLDVVPGSQMEVRASGTFHGTLYAPQVDFELPAGLRFFGALAAKSVALAEGAHVSYDVALATSTGLGIQAVPRILSWRIVELPDVPLVKIRIDPLAQLALAGVTPVPSDLAHRETKLKLSYTSTSGMTLLFAGFVGMIGWGGISTVDGIQWQDPVTLAYFPSPAIRPQSVSETVTVETY